MPYLYLKKKNIFCKNIDFVTSPQDFCDKICRK